MGHRWTRAEDSILRQLYPNTKCESIATTLAFNVTAIYRRAQKLGLRKSAEFLASRESGRIYGDRGQATRFSPGGQPWNKGTSHGPDKDDLRQATFNFTVPTTTSPNIA